MENIICTVPYACGEKGCSVGWHLSHYWIYDDGTYSECDSDGNRVDCDEGDVPDADAERAAWNDYARFVADTGTDPLGNYLVKHTVERKERWTLQFSRSIVGIVLTGARRGRGGQWLGPAGVPHHVAQFAGVTDERLGKQSFRLVTYLCAEDACEHLSKSMRWTGLIDNKTPRNPATVQRELRALARKTLSRERT